MKKTIKRIGVFTSGGDAPGMNAAIRAVVRACHYYDIDVYGIYRGYQGMIEGEMKPFEARAVSNIIQRGGTILKSARSDDFRTPEGRKKAYKKLQKKGIDALVVIGGDGSFTGAHLFHQEYGIPVMGVPGTIDNDLVGTDYTIGYDTATNTAVDCIDKIRDTASSHNRLFYIEVMGRHAGFIAMRSGIAAGAEVVLIPEKEVPVEEIVNTIRDSSKSFNLVVVAEGNKNGGAFEISKKVQEHLGYFESKVTVLGHIQRGGKPSVFDRVLASRLGIAAVEALLNGDQGAMAGVVNNKIVLTPFEIAISGERTFDDEIWRINKILST